MLSTLPPQLKSCSVGTPQRLFCNSKTDSGSVHHYHFLLPFRGIQPFYNFQDALQWQHVSSLPSSRMAHSCRRRLFSGTTENPSAPFLIHRKQTRRPAEQNKYLPGHLGLLLLTNARIVIDGLPILISQTTRRSSDHIHPCR